MFVLNKSSWLKAVRQEDVSYLLLLELLLQFLSLFLQRDVFLL